MTSHAIRERRRALAAEILAAIGAGTYDRAMTRELGRLGTLEAAARESRDFDPTRS